MCYSKLSCNMDLSNADLIIHVQINVQQLFAECIKFNYMPYML
jgi:hypothetical protein